MAGTLHDSAVAIAQSVPLAQPVARSTQVASRSTETAIPVVQQFIYVDATQGNDAGATGSEQSPFRSMTQALRFAAPNSVIVLAPGTYSTQTGEVFPLQVQAGIKIQGDPARKGQGVVIRGGGDIISSIAARQNVTMLAGDQAEISGVTISNPNPRGYGLWLESTSPIVVNNTFTGNTHDGISTVGSASPVIWGNIFIENGANGVSLFGTGQPEVRENVFQNTGYGINVAQTGTPLIISNRITQNRAGVVVQQNARPILRGNVIEDSTEDGVVAIAQAQPDLGTANDSGYNTFRNNRRYDINTQATSQIVPAYGNQFAASRTVGQIDWTGVSGQSSLVAMQEAENRQQSAASLPSSPQAITQPSPPSSSRSNRSQPANQRSTVANSESNSSANRQAIVPQANQNIQATNRATGSPSNLSDIVPTLTSATQATQPTATQAAATTRQASTRQSVAPSATPSVAPSQPTVNRRQSSARSTTRSTTQSSAQSIAIEVPVPTPTRSSARSSDRSLARSSARSSAQTDESIAVDIPVPTPVSSAAPATRSPRSSRAPERTANLSRSQTTRISTPPAQDPLLASAASPDASVQIQVPPPVSRAVIPRSPAIAAAMLPSRPEPRPVTPSNLLPVPGGSIPVGNSGDMVMPSVLRPPTEVSLFAGGQDTEIGRVPTFSPAASLRYRVIVAAENGRQERRVRSIVPNAFATSWRGRSALQVGAFSDRDNAQEIADLLEQNGLRAVVESLDN